MHRINRREALTALLAGLGVAGCEPGGPADSPIPDEGTPLQAGRMATALGAVFSGTPLEAIALTLPQALESDIAHLRAQGLEASAELLSRTTNGPLLGIWETQASLVTTADLNVEPKPFAEAFKEGLVGFLREREALTSLAVQAATELAAANGSDTLSAESQDTAAGILGEHEQLGRLWMHEEDRSGDAYANSIFRMLQTQRADCSEPRSIQGLAGGMTDAIEQVGVYDSGALGEWFRGQTSGSSPPPPPYDIDQMCTIIGILALMMMPVNGAAGLAGAADDADELFEIGMLALDSGMTVDDMLLDDRLGEDPCNTLWIVLQTLLQGLAFLLSVIALAVALAAFGGAAGLAAVLVALQGGMAVAGAVCAFDKAMTLLYDWEKNCA